MNYLSEQKRTLSFRRLPFAAKRRRARPLLAAARRTLKFSAVAIPLLVLCAWFVVSDRFTYNRLETQGVERVDVTWIQQHVSGLAGHNLLLADLGPIRAAIEEHPWISDLRLQKDLPSRLVVTVTEHEPAAILTNPEGDFLLSSAGERIVALNDIESQGAELEALHIVDSGAAMGPAQMSYLIELCNELERSATPWARQVEAVRILSPEDVEITFRNVGLLVRARTNGSFEILEDQLATVHDLLPQLEDRMGRFQAVDLRFDRRLVLVPVEPEGPLGSKDSTTTSRFRVEQTTLLPTAGTPGPTAGRTTASAALRHSIRFEAQPTGGVDMCAPCARGLQTQAAAPPQLSRPTTDRNRALIERIERA